MGIVKPPCTREWRVGPGASEVFSNRIQLHNRHMHRGLLARLWWVTTLPWPPYK